MRPRPATFPTRNVGAPGSGALNDALIRMRLSLTWGSRWRTLPASQFADGAAAARPDSAMMSAGTPAASAADEVARRKSRRLKCMLAPGLRYGCDAMAIRPEFTGSERPIQDGAACRAPP